MQRGSKRRPLQPRRAIRSAVRRLQRTELEAEISNTMPYANNAGVKIYWEEHGEGEPLLLIMGLGYTMDMWNRTAPVLSESYRTITFDNRGVGRSDVPSGPYPIATMAADAAAV